MNVNAVNTGGAVSPNYAVPVESGGVDDPGRKNNPEAKQAQTQPGNADTKKMVAEMQARIDQMNISLTFSTYGKNKDRIAIVLSNKETGEVIREIPPEEIQKLYAKLSELVGLIFNDTA
ncbi:MAG TPA: flagellar protein FlaG [Syntrophales bacterium]|nr:flagellar protein FlaG [Syntrophales bacterium]HRT27761.1 flagellar protein FlaG [Syntrophales bacterium]HRT70730.1 flagellar protein FlaG [Syntrophales bacterium]